MAVVHVSGVRNLDYAVMASTDPAMKRHKSDDEISCLRRRAMTVLFSEHPTGAERVTFHLLFSVPDSLPELVDLTDDELRDALQTTLLRMLRVPS